DDTTARASFICKAAARQSNGQPAAGFELSRPGGWGSVSPGGMRGADQTAVGRCGLAIGARERAKCSDATEAKPLYEAPADYCLCSGGYGRTASVISICGRHLAGKRHGHFES